MADEKYLNAAKKAASDRTPAEQRLVDKGSNQQDVRNTAFEAERQKRAFG